jgi:chlorobactene glucosyltransferase
MLATNHLDIYTCLVSIVILYFIILSCCNMFYLWHNTTLEIQINGPKISILIPARNEAENIERCLMSLVRQSYSQYELIVLDDNSTDNTAKIIKRLQVEYPKIKLISGKELATGWHGKAFAMQQLLEAATGEYLLFVDADTVHHHDMAAFSVSNMLEKNADLMSGYTKHSMRNWGERLIVPTIYLMMAMVFPFFLIKSSKFARNSFAIGMYMMYRKQTLTDIGGFAVVKNEINEDIMMARIFKKHQKITTFIDAKSMITTNMYNSFKAAYRGISKNIFPAADKNIFESTLIVVLIFAIFLLPILLFTESLLIGVVNYKLLLPIMLMLCMWFLVLMNRQHPVIYTLTCPIMMAILLCITITSTKKIAFGKGVLWKDRFVK